MRTGSEMAGVNGVTVNFFQARLCANLKALQSELHKGRHAPQPVKRLSISKADGSQRPLGILTVRDRIVQRAVLIVVEPLFEAQFETCSHGCRKGRSVRTALTQLCPFINQGYWMDGLSRLETRPLKASRSQAALPRAARPETVHTMTPAQKGNDTWERSI